MAQPPDECYLGGLCPSRGPGGVHTAKEIVAGLEFDMLKGLSVCIGNSHALNSGNGFVLIVAGSVASACAICAFIYTELVWKRREPQRRRRTGYGKYLTATQQLRRLPILAIVGLAAIGFGVWVIQHPQCGNTGAASPPVPGVSVRH